MNISTLRKGVVIALKPWLWGIQPLREANLDPNPVKEFDKWFQKANRCFWLEFPDAMCLSTVDGEGWPDARMVLLKHFDEQGFVFYTNTLSAKGGQLGRAPRAALTFYWEALQRQVRIRGAVEPATGAEADDYFASRLRLSQIGAWASEQSKPLDRRETLERRVAEFKKKFAGQPVPRPPHWGGYRVIPRSFEFWKLRYNRLHDRFLYSRSASGTWTIQRLNP